MYFQLRTDNFNLEYVDDILTITNSESFCKIKGHNILNIIIVINNLYPGVFIDSFVKDELTISQDKDNIYITNTSIVDNKSKDDNFINKFVGNSREVTGVFIVKDSLIPDLITILNQAHKLISGIFSLKRRPPKELESVKNV